MRARGLVAALYLLTLPGSEVWAQVARVSLSRNSPSARPALSLPGSEFKTLPASAPGLAPKGLRPALGAPTVDQSAASAGEAAQATLAHEAPGVVEASARVFAPAAPSRPVEAGAAPSVILESAGLDAVEVAARPGSLESDAGRVDFTVHGPGRLGTDAPVVPGGEAPESSGRSGLTKGGETPRGPPEKGKLGAYLAGSFMTQLSHGGLMVTLPLVLMQITSSLSAVSFVSAVATGMDAVGTLIGGRLGRKFSPRALLIGANLVRAAALALIPAALAFGVLTVPLAGAVYAADSLARGVADTAANTAPMALVGKSKQSLDGMNARIQAAMETGSVVGPLVVGGLLFLGKAAAAWVVPLAFVATAAAFLFMPKSPENPGAAPAPAQPQAKPRPGLLAWGALRALKTDRMLWAAFVGAIAFNLFSLRGLIPAFFAGSFLGNDHMTPWLAAACGLGGGVAALVYHKLHRKMSTAAWLKWGAAGLAVLALGWLPGNFAVMLGTFFAFALGNVLTRLSLASVIQSRIPQGEESSVMGLLRFTGSIASTAIKLLVGLIFAVTTSDWAGFAILGVLLAAAALAQLSLSGKMARLEEKTAPKKSPDVGLNPDP